MPARVLLLLVLAACGEKAPDDSSSTDDTATSAPCGESGSCDLTVTDAAYECNDADPGGESLSATVDTDGTVQVTHIDYGQGCCPTLSVTAQASPSTAELTASYDLAGDDCDCVCLLDLRYALSGVPSGAWTLLAPGGASTTLTVP